MIDYNAILNRFKDKLDSATVTGSNDIRLQRNEYSGLGVAISNMMIENAKLKELNRALADKLIAPRNDISDMDGGSF